ncbi:myosin light chain kinase, smooth muscle-like isoform X2 [Patiria miniata]|nr:myosin light chain kinase, smooth muscle-like isoform X2 [Patiria miniata]
MKERKPKPWDPVPARFLNRIEDLTVTEGEEALFRCQIIGHPIPEVTWFQDDEVLCPCQDVKMTFDGRTTFMIIAAAYPEDSGQYTCQIYNGLGGRLNCSAHLKVKKIKSRKLVPKPPEFTEVFHDRTVAEGTEVKFECRIRGNPKPKVAWLFNNKELKQSPDFLFFRKHNLYVLHIVEAFPEDEGEYTCRAFNSVGESQWSAELFVEETQSTIPSPAIGTITANFFRPSFLSHTKDCKAVEGGPATFNCKVTGSPEPEVVWLFNQSEIGANDHHILEHGEDGSCMLIIPHVTPKDVGEYTCVARSSLGVAQSIAGLEVTERISDDDQEQDSGYRGQERRLSDDFRCSSSGSADIPSRPVGKPNVSKIAGESILLTWETIPNNDLDSTVMYIIEGKDASEEDWILIATDVTDTSYWVSSVNPEGGYVFRVRAEGENGISEPSEESDVVCLMHLLSKNQEASASGSCLKKQNSVAIAKDIKPFFMDSLEDVYVMEHATAVLSCKVLCEPPPIVKWFRDEDIINNERMQATYKEDGTCLLEIKDVTYKDIGEYECVAENKTGKASCRLYLDVAEAPDIIKGFADTSAPAGEQLRLDVRVGGIPEPDVIWYKDNRPLSPTSKFSFLFEGEDMCSLKIDQAVPDDEGCYKMTAINMAGEVSHSAKVTVPDPMKYFFSDSRITIKKDITVEDEYDVQTELGRGAYGVVKKCTNKKTGKECAVKIIRVKNGMWDDLRREVLVMGMLDHKRLINIYDSYETKQDVIMVMELVSGGELFERIVSQDHITESETVFFVKQVIEGVHHMHQKNIVHLDLKPENILLVSPDSDDLKVIDFGLARVVSPDRDVICKFGTPEFVAPEVVCKQPVTTASDVWSIGVMAHILLSGISPFMGEDDKQTLIKVKRGYWDFEDEVWDDISDEAKEFLKAVMVLDPKKRLTLDQCLQHSWLKFDERHDQGVAKLSTQRLKTFNSRRKWQKALTAVKSAMRLRRLSSIAASDINAFRQRQLQGKGQSQDAGSQEKDNKTLQVDGEGEGGTQAQTGMGYGFDEDDDDHHPGILPLPCIIDDCMGAGDDENPACLVVPPFKAQSIMGHPLHDSEALSTGNAGLSAENTGMGVCDVSHNACVLCQCNACLLEMNLASYVECACVHDPSLVKCCDLKETGVLCQCVQNSRPRDSANHSRITDVEPFESNFVPFDQCDVKRSNLKASERDSPCSLSTSVLDRKCIATSSSVCKLLHKLAVSPEEFMLLLKDALRLLSTTKDCEETFAYDLDRTSINVLNSADITSVSCERVIGEDYISVTDTDIAMQPMTTLAGCYTEHVPDLDLEAVPPSEASAELDQMKQENGKADGAFFTFDGVNGEMSNGKENEASQDYARSGSKEAVKGKVGKIGWGSILGSVAKNGQPESAGAKETSCLDDEPQKQAHPGAAAFSKRKWSKSKLVLPSTLRRIQENRALSTEEAPPAGSSTPEKETVDHNSNSSAPLPRRLSSKWSKESMDSVDFGDDYEPEVEESSSLSPEVMAFDSRHSAEKKRRILKDEEVSSPQIFGKEAEPKLLSITELMLKISRDNKRKESESRDSPQKLDPQRLSPNDAASLSTKRSPEVGRLRAVSFNTSQEFDLKGHLDFLVCEVDERLNLGRYETWMLLRYSQTVRFVAGVIFGMVIGALCRIIF